MTKPTPGPWTLFEEQWAEEDSGGFHIIFADVEESPGSVQTVRLLNYAEGVYADEPGYDEARANARLIAAAPELLAACKAALPELEQEAERREFAGRMYDAPNYASSIRALADRLRAAIAKAEPR